MTGSEGGKGEGSEGGGVEARKRGPYYSASSSFPVELTKLNNQSINKRVYDNFIFRMCNVIYIIFWLTLLLLVLLTIISPIYTLYCTLDPPIYITENATYNYYVIIIIT